MPALLQTGHAPNSLRRKFKKNFSLPCFAHGIVEVIVSDTPLRSFSRTAQKGLSVLELMIAMAIMALVSIALSQSMLLWFRLSASASNAAERAIADTIRQEQFQTVVRGLMAAWPDEVDATFTGTPDGFRGLTRFPLHFADPGLEVVFVVIAERDDLQVVNYQGGDAQWDFLTLPGSTELSFSYLGLDGQWRENWPPAEVPLATPGEASPFFEIPPLPIAIRLTMDSDPPAVWVADIGSEPALPFRSQDALGNL